MHVFFLLFSIRDYLCHEQTFHFHIFCCLPQNPIYNSGYSHSLQNHLQLEQKWLVHSFYFIYKNRSSALDDCNKPSVSVTHGTSETHRSIVIPVNWIFRGLFLSNFQMFILEEKTVQHQKPLNVNARNETNCDI